MTSPEQLVQILDGAIGDAVERSGSWLACRPGCSQCCHGVFSISALDASRLQAGLRSLELADPARAAAVRQRVLASAARLASTYPGDPASGAIFQTPEALAVFDDFADDEPCPVLDPVTQTCDLYQARPVLCRTFGPPLQTPEAGLAVCELCFDGAAPEVVEQCQIDPVILIAEQEANTFFEQQNVLSSAAANTEPYRTIITFALSSSIASSPARGL